MLSVISKKQSFEFYNCRRCKVFESKIRNINKVLQVFVASKNRLTNIIGNQKYFSNKHGLGFRKYNQKRFSMKKFDNINCFFFLVMTQQLVGIL